MGNRSIQVPLEPDGEPRIAITVGLFGSHTEVRLDGGLVASIASAADLRRGQSLRLPDDSTLHVQEIGWPIGRRLFVRRDSRLVYGAVRDPNAVLRGAALGFAALVALRQLVFAVALLFASPLVGIVGIACVGGSLEAAYGIYRGRMASVHVALVVIALQWIFHAVVQGKEFALGGSIAIDATVWFLVAHARYAVQTLAWTDGDASREPGQG